MKKFSLVLSLFFCSLSIAVPTFQVAAPGGTFDGSDTWFISSSGSFDLTLVGAFGPKTYSLTGCVLIASVPKTETGTISVTETGTGTLQGATLKTSGATADVLTNVAGNDAYLDKSIFPANFNDHDTFKESMSNFVLFDIGSFADLGAVHNYQYPVTLDGTGQERTFSIDVTGFSTAHFDMYGFVTDEQGHTRIVTSWEMNPGSHDSSWFHRDPPVVPVPGALLLAGIGTAVVAGYKKFRMV